MGDTEGSSRSPEQAEGVRGEHRLEAVVFSPEGTDEAGTGWTDLGLVSLALGGAVLIVNELQILEYQESIIIKV